MNLRRSMIWILAVASAAALGGCGDSTSGPGPGPAPADAKAEASSAHIERLGLLLAGDAAGFVAKFSPDALDLGGGPSGTGVPPPGYFTAAHWQAIIDSPEFDELRGRTPGDLLDLTSTTALTKSEREAIRGPIVTPSSFRMQDGDLEVVTFPLPGSPLFDGWFAIYRKINGAWLVVAFD